MANYFLIAGEASGDKHAAALMAQIKQRDPQAQFAGLGGDQMVAAGCRLYRDYRRMAFMGIAAVVRHWRDVKENFRIAREALLTERPDTLILIDYPSFNLRMAAFCRKQLPQTKIIYYIPPKVWAWKKRRVHRIARLCDEVLGIFPFEPAFYARYGYRCTYVGNPTAEEMEHFAQRRKTAGAQRQKNAAEGCSKTITLLPGSRPSEISNSLPRMLEAARRFPNYSLTVCAAPGIDDAFYRPYLRADETLTRDTYSALQSAAAAVVNSGTATLETALLGCPQVAVYHLACSRLISIIRCVGQPMLFSIQHFTLVNIIAGKEVIKEYLANEFTTDNVAAELERLLTDDAYKKEMVAQYKHLSQSLGAQPASATAAAIITSKR